MRLHISEEIAAADWLRPLLRPFGVAAIVPSGFPAYARILHPALGRNGEHVRWDVIAARSSRIMHRLAQFHAIAASRTPIKPSSEPRARMEPPPRKPTGRTAAHRVRDSSPTYRLLRCLLVLRMGRLRLAQRKQHGGGDCYL